MAILHLFIELRRRLAGFGSDQRGQIALMFAVGLPAIGLLTFGGIDLAAVSAARSKLQDMADAAALAGANELGLAIDGDAAIERAGALVDGHMSEWSRGPTVKKAIVVLDREGQRVIEVKLEGHMESFFGSMLPPGGWNFSATARAVQVGLTPLCVLVSGTSGSKLLNIKDNGRISAPACLVHSNRDIQVDGGSITASQVQAVTSATGAISPQPGTGAASVADPFKDMNLKEPTGCPLIDLAVPDVLTGVYYIQAGVHCGKFAFGGDAVVRLAPGEHWFSEGKLEIKDNARLIGDDVVLFFDRKSKFDFKGQSLVKLDGRRTGAYAGMVLVTVRGNTQDFSISSDHVESLLGVIYVPDARLIVDGKADVARDSAWTVIVARELSLRGSPSLVINANYTITSVPVPKGVGPRDGGSQLVE